VVGSFDADRVGYLKTIVRGLLGQLKEALGVSRKLCVAESDKPFQDVLERGFNTLCDRVWPLVEQ